MSKVVVTGSEHWLDQYNILHTKVMPNAAIDVSEALLSINARNSIHPNQPTGFLLDLREIKSSSKEARTIFQEDLGIPNRYFAMAVLVGNTLSRMIGSSYLGYNRPENLPVKLFENIQEAHDWLCCFQRKHYEQPGFLEKQAFSISDC